MQNSETGDHGISRVLAAPNGWRLTCGRWTLQSSTGPTEPNQPYR